MLDTPSAPPLSAEEITVELGGIRILNQVSFTAGPGSLMGVVGPNGAGKSTLFNTLTGLLKAKEGRVLVHGKPVNSARGALAYVPQWEKVNWRIPLNVWDVAMLGRSRHVGWFRRPGRADREAVEDALNQVWMWDQRFAMIDELSGGQRQRVFVARALAQGADVIMLDEAFSGVDFTSQEVMSLVLEDMRDEGRTILISSHDIDYVKRFCDQCLCINRRVVACGPTEEVLVPEILGELYRSSDLYSAYGSLAPGADGHHH